jgi:hypothetical protein
MPERLIKKTMTPEAPAKIPEIKNREQLFESVIKTKGSKNFIDIVRKVFEHSAEDGLLLADRFDLDLNEFDWVTIIISYNFRVKHPLIFEDLIRIIKKEVKGKNSQTQGLKERLIGTNGDEGFINSYLEAQKTGDWDYVSEMMDFENIAGEEMGGFSPEAEQLLGRISEYYAPLLRTRKFKTVDTAPSDYPRGEMVAGRRPGETRELNSVEELADEALEQEQLLRLPAYYARQTEAILNRYLKEHGHNLEDSRSSFASDYFVTEKDISDECEQLNIPFEEIKSRLKSARYFSITAPIKRVEAKKGLIKKLNEELAGSGQKVKLVGDKYEVVDDEQKIEKKEDAEEEEEFDFAKFEEKTLDLLERIFAKKRIQEHHLARMLVGLDSEQAWAWRQELYDAGYKSFVVEGLIGLDSEQAWDLRKKHDLEGKHGIQSFLVSLAGMDSERAWQKRREVFNAKRYLKDEFIASALYKSLNGLDSAPAWEMRRTLIPYFGDLNLAVTNLGGLDSQEAWDLRNEMLERGVNKNKIVHGLNNIDSEQAWAMREKFLDEGVDKGQIAFSLGGLDSERAQDMRKRLVKEGVSNNLIAQSFTGLNSDYFWDLRETLDKEGIDGLSIAIGMAGFDENFVWQMKLKEKQKENKESKETTQDEQKQLDLINLLHRPTLEGIFGYFGGIGGARLEKELELGTRNELSESSAFINTINKLIGRKPELFLGTMPAKRDHLPEVYARRLAVKIFPELSRNQEKKVWHGFPGYSGFEAGKAAGSPDPADYLKPDFESEFSGGGAEGMSDNREIMEFREAMNGIVVTGIFGQYSASEKKWKKADFAVDAPITEPALETTATIPNIKGLTEVTLPKPLEARIIPERVKGFDAAGREYDLEIKTEITGETRVIKKPKAVEKIVYSLSVSQAPAPLEDLSAKDYGRYRQQLEAVSGRKLTEELGMLPEDLELQLLEAIKGKTPKQQVAAIERLVRDLGYYDTNNQEVNQLKRGKSLEEQIYIMEQRTEELRQKHPELAEELAGKRFAGVCADFAQLSATLLRRAGFASGMISGFGGQDKKIKVKHAHSTAFVVWPDAEGHNRVISIDGTPDGVSGVSLPSLLEKEAEVAGQDKELSQIALKEIQKIIEGLNRLDVETVRQMSNGELERVLNGILKYQVKESHLAIIERLFDYYWYTPIHQLDLANPYQRSEAILQLAGAVERQRQRLASQPESDETPAGNKLMQTMQDFLGRFTVAGMTEDKDEALTMMEKIVELVQNDLSEVEKKSAFATIAYLKAKNILGEKK